MTKHLSGLMLWIPDYRSFVPEDSITLTINLQCENLSYGNGYFHYMFIYGTYLHKKGCYQTHVIIILFFYLEWLDPWNTRNTQFQSSTDRVCFLLQSFWNCFSMICLLRQRSEALRFMISWVLVKNFWRYLPIWVEHMSG